MTNSPEIVCPQCAGINRVPKDRDLSAARCGKCKSPLLTGRPVDSNATMFERQTRRSTVPVLVDVWAPWCGPCRMMAPHFEASAAELEPGFRLLKLNSEAEPEIAARLGIRGIPTMLLFADGKEVARTSGAMIKDQITAWARSQLGRYNQTRSK